MDRHFRLASPAENAPMLAAFADLLYTQRMGAETRAVFAYDERLRLLPSYLQQLEMESNGKSVSLDGQPVAASGAITWGGVGTDAQHAVFQRSPPCVDRRHIDKRKAHQDHGNGDGKRDAQQRKEASRGSGHQRAELSNPRSS